VSKWREFWLDHDCYYTQNEITQSVSTEYPINPVSLVHVIEYEATEELRATELVYNMNRRWIEDAKIKLAKLTEANLILRDGLEFYGNDGPGFICMCEEEVGDGPMSGWVQCDSGDNARTALEQADKIMEGEG
jgi:hypothetical protein